jgi:hypothetical protein
MNRRDLIKQTCLLPSLVNSSIKPLSDDALVAVIIDLHCSVDGAMNNYGPFLHDLYRYPHNWDLIGWETNVDALHRARLRKEMMKREAIQFTEDAWNNRTVEQWPIIGIAVMPATRG